jgi:hypothetical protein
MFANPQNGMLKKLRAFSAFVQLPVRHAQIRAKDENQAADISP